MFQALPRTDEARIIGKQVLRCGTAVAANYRAACRARSRVEFISRLAVVVEESDETVFWLELLVEAGIVRPQRMDGLLEEANELLRILSASRHTAKSHAQPITKSPNH